MLRTVAIGLVSLFSLGAILALVFAVGALRIHLANAASEAAPSDRPAPVPATRPTTKPADPSPVVVAPPAVESIDLLADKATLTAGLKLEKDTQRTWNHKGKHGQTAHPDPPPAPQEAIVGWQAETDSAEWSAKVPKQGVYEVDLVCACAAGSRGTLTYVLAVGSQELMGEASSAHGGKENYQVLTVGSATFPAGDTKVRFHLTGKARSAILRLRSVRLIPAS